MFSTRLPSNLTDNRLTVAVERLRASGRDFIDLTDTNPTHAGFDYAPDLLTPLADRRALDYTPSPLGLPVARQAVANEYSRRGLTVDAERVVLAASTSEAYSILFKLLADARDEVLVPRPSYPLFDHLTALDSVVARPYDLEYHGRWSIDLASLEQAITDRTRAVLVVSPNNPTGSVATVAEVDFIARMSGPREIALISDEVFAGYALVEGAEGGYLIDRRDVLTFTLGGLSKSIGLPQVKLGWIVVGGPEHLVSSALKRLELVCDTYLSVGTPVQIATVELLRRGVGIRRQIMSRIATNHAWLDEAVGRVPSCRLLRADGGWSAVIEVPTLQREEDLVLDLLERRRVLAHPGYFFDFPRGSHLVVSLLAPESVFAEGVTRVLRHFDCSAGAL